MSTTQDQQELDSIAALGEQCLLHLERETAVMSTAGEMLEHLQTAVRASDPRKLAQALHAQESACRDILDMKQQRQSFREHAARTLQIPVQAVTLSRLGDVMSAETRNAMLEKRDALRSCVADVERRTREIALVSHYFLDFVQRFFAEITGTASAGSRYGPHGQPSTHAACGSLLQAQG